MIRIYTDVSLRSGHAVTTCFVITDTNFLGYRIYDYKGICTSMHGELLGILGSIKYVKSLRSSEDSDVDTSKICVYCDSDIVLQILDGTYVKKRFQRTVKEIQEECEGLDVEFLYVKGHQRSRNPNKIVDFVSNSVLNYKYPMK